jgi:hypothetical protein
MNPIDDQLNRLFRAARKTESVETPMPFGLETRALAAWRGSGRLDVGFWDMSVLVRGLVVAIVIMGASMWPALNKTTTTTDPLSEYVQVSDTTLASDETP